ncbi:MAG: LamG domain-containing protein [Candidatus Paceibacterota bacterium]
MKKFLFTILSLTFLFSIADNSHAATLAKPSNNLGLVGYWSFEDATSTASVGTKATDFSGRGNKMTLTNGPTWTDGKMGKALRFDGGNDYAATTYGATNSGIDALSNNFSISLWMKSADTAQTDNYILGKLNESESNNTYAIIYGYTANQVEFFGGTSEFSGTNPRTGTGISITDTNWHHVVYAYDGSAWRGYRDGAEIFSTSRTFSLGTSAKQLVLGGFTSAAADQFYNGSLDDVRIYNRALTATEVTSLYNSGAGKLIQASKTGLVGYWPFDEGTSTAVTDFSGRGNTGTINGGAMWVAGKRGGALQFDGVDDWVSFANVPTSNTDEWAMSAWISPSTLPQFAKTVMSNGFDNAVNAGDGYSFGIGHQGGSSDTLMAANNGVSWIVPQYTFDSADRWHHVVMQRRDGWTVFFVDGVQTAGNTTQAPSTPTKFSIGAANDNNGNPTREFAGKIDEVRVYNRPLSVAEIQSLYQSGGRKINVSQNRTGSSLDTGLVGMWSFNGQDISGATAYDRSGNGNNGTISGAIPGIGKIGQTLKFDGVDDYVEIPDSSLWDFSGAFTWSAWIKLTSAPGQWDGVISRDGTSPYPIYLRFANSSLIDFGIDNSGSLTYALSPSIGRWYHIVALWDGSSTKRIYIDGVDVAQNAQATAPTATNDALYIGLDYLPGNSRNFPGYIDEVRVYNRALSASEVKQLYNLGK